MFAKLALLWLVWKALLHVHQVKVHAMMKSSKNICGMFIQSHSQQGRTKA